MSTASRQILDLDDAHDIAAAVRPLLREVVRDQIAVRDHVVHNQVDWEPFESPWRAPQALLDLIGASTAGQRPQRPLQ